jgi:hypothetical protein
MAKVIGRKKLEESGLASRVRSAVNSENGACHASVIMGICLDMSDKDIADGLKRYKAGLHKEASERQRKAVERCLYGRHYSKESLFRLELYLSAPLENARDWYGADKIRVIRCINITAIKEAQAKEAQRQADIEAGIPAGMVQELTAEQKEALDITF